MRSVGARLHARPPVLLLVALLAGSATVTTQPQQGPDRAVLETFVGEYEFGPTRVSVMLRPDGVLTYWVPGQPLYELRFAEGLRFWIRGLFPRVSIEFVRDPSGAVTHLVSRQINGNFPARRVGGPAPKPPDAAAPPPVPAASAPAAPAAAAPTPTAPTPTTAAAPAAVATAAAGPAASPAGAAFSQPEPDHVALFRLYMAANADVLGTDKAAAWEHHLIFTVPSGDGSPAGVSRECMAVHQALRNEIAAGELLKRVEADFVRALAAARSAPKTAIFRLRTRESLGRYDAARRAFPLEAAVSGATVLVPTPRIGLAPRKLMDGTGMYPGPVQATCAVGGVPPGAGYAHAPAFTLELRGNERFKELPMEQAAAAALLDANPERIVDVEVLVDVGPALITPGLNTPIGVPARIVAARVLNPRDGTVLHTFPADPAPAATTEAAAAASGGDRVPLTSNRALLLTLRDHPSLATPDAIRAATTYQVYAEQQMWKNVDLLFAPNMQGQRRWNPKGAKFTYEWQTMLERRPDLAKGALIDVFLRPDADWSFVTRDAAWDPRFEAVVVPAVFARDRIEGRDGRFAAEELMPVFKQHLDLAVSRAPTKFWLPVLLAGFHYDFATRTMRFDGVAYPRHMTPPRDGGDLLPPASDGLMEFHLPPSVGGRAAYQLMASVALMQRADAKPTRPGVPFGGTDATDDWRRLWPIGGSGNPLASVAVLALDRRLHLAPVPMEPARAEPIVKKGAAGLTARIYFDAEQVERAEGRFDGQRYPYAILVGKVQKVDVLDAGGQVIATVAASALPAPARVAGVRLAQPSRSGE